MICQAHALRSSANCGVDQPAVWERFEKQPFRRLRCVLSVALIAEYQTRLPQKSMLLAKLQERTALGAEKLTDA